MAKDKQTDFESSLKALESIVKRLEDENINLEDSVKSFEEGINLVKECQKQLQEAELKIKTLLDDGSSIDLEDQYGVKSIFARLERKNFIEYEKIYW